MSDFVARASMKRDVSLTKQIRAADPCQSPEAPVRADRGSLAETNSPTE